jgi:hypothetical protein
MEDFKEVLQDIKKNYENIRKSRYHTWSVDRNERALGTTKLLKDTLIDITKVYPALKGRYADNISNALTRLAESESILVW